MATSSQRQVTSQVCCSTRMSFTWKISGDEIAGLTQAFLTAGAKAVLSSLWLIADARTLELMTHFYTTLRDDPSEALAATQRMAHRDGIDPLHWAAFSLFA